MAKEFAYKFYRSKAWLTTRQAYISSVFGLCERCSAGGKVVHHITELDQFNINDPDITLNWDNLELLCQDCHNREHHGSEATVSGVRFDEDGNLYKLETL